MQLSETAANCTVVLGETTEWEIKQSRTRCNRKQQCAVPFHYGLARTVERVFIDLTAIFSIKDFSASKLQGQPGLAQLTNGQPKSSREQQGKSDINVWGEDDVDSVKVNIAIKKNYHLALFHTSVSSIPKLLSVKDGAYYCYYAYVLRISRYSDFLSPMLTNTGIFLRGLKLSGESRS